MCSGFYGFLLGCLITVFVIDCGRIYARHRERERRERIQDEEDERTDMLNDLKARFGISRD
jgi:hypothetical protein